MKILVICQYYYPEPFRISDICEEMVARGHEVTVVTGLPNYPEGQIYEGYKNRQHFDEVINGVIVHRCPIIPRKNGAIYRFLNYYSYQIKADSYIKTISASADRKFDVVFVNQLSPIMMTKPAIIYKRLNRVPVVMYCLDLWPESLVAGGIDRSSFIYKYYHGVSHRLYHSADKILITSQMFRDYLQNEFGIDDNKIEYLPQYAEGIFQLMPYKEPDSIINLVFAGNIGEIQSVDTIVNAAAVMKNKPVHFHIVGGGTDLERLKKMADGLSNLTFYGRRPISEMPEFYKIADAMLVTLKADPVLSLTLPGKVQSYLAVGKPIIGAIDGETSTVINEAKCGYCGPAEDVDCLVDNICRFIDSKDKNQMGKNARLIYEKHFNRNRFMNTLENELRKMYE